ncbi:hypothetical protein IFM89_025333 [Coptis chinensis]|uniref:Uncharacterized protein n=1 Tax=Coptis chinensis TaxID=261450 RepID=A0A835M4X5_9MAGN|nr:hypothetical protein IFM89_025333 [Coptis chinensis]
MESHLKAVDDETLPSLWKGKKPFKSLQDVKKYFGRRDGSVCLGILNGSEVGLEDLNIIGDIWLQDLLVIYDNEKRTRSVGCQRLHRASQVRISPCSDFLPFMWLKKDNLIIKSFFCLLNKVDRDDDEPLFQSAYA